MTIFILRFLAQNYRLLFFLGLWACLLDSPKISAGPFSPGEWPKEEKERLETLEFQSWSPLSPKSFESTGGIISATVSPVAIHAGMQALQHGGTAADAAAITALTQITTQLGSVVSYAGIFTLLYYEAKTRKVHSMDAGYNSYLHETDPLTIPVGDLGPLNYSKTPTEGGAKGRETLVPGFMAGVEAMHARFGRLPFPDLFESAIWYAEHGVTISPTTSVFFGIRAKQLSRTPEGREFIHQTGHDGLPKVGDNFIQLELAKTLKEVAAHGSRAMYAGRWAEEFVRLVQREGGNVTAEDLSRYQPIWSDPYQATAFGHTIYVNGAPHFGAYALITGLHLAEARKLQNKGPYWSDPETFQDLAQITHFVAAAPSVSPSIAAHLKDKGLDLSPAAQLRPAYAEAVAPLLSVLKTLPADDGPHHSNCIVVVDREGNIAAVTHTINAVIWGDSGIVVGGIPLPDSAAFQQKALAALPPGDRLPHQIVDTLCFAEGKPVLATASIGSSLIPESIRVLLGVLGQHQSLKTIMAAPPLLANFDPTVAAKPLVEQPTNLPDQGYRPEFIAELEANGILLNKVSSATASQLRGHISAVTIDAKTGMRSAEDQPEVMIYNQAE